MSELLVLRVLDRLSTGPLSPISTVSTQVLNRLWEWKPGLITRLSNFLLIGGIGTVIQFSLLFLLWGVGVELLVATLIGIQAAAIWSFTANRFVTWSDRFAGLSRRQNLLWFFPLFLISDLTTVTIWVKVIGINATVDHFGFPLIGVWVVFELLGTIANYVGADKISFGLMARVISRVSSPVSPEPVLVSA